MAEDLPGPPGSGSRDDRPGKPPPPPRGGPTPPPPPWAGQPGYGYPPGPPTEGLATAALVVAILGWFVCPVGAIVALIMANNAKQRIEASGGRLTGLKQAQAARTIATIELVLIAIALLLLAIPMLLGINDLE